MNTMYDMNRRMTSTMTAWGVPCCPSIGGNPLIGNPFPQTNYAMYGGEAQDVKQDTSTKKDESWFTEVIGYANELLPTLTSIFSIFTQEGSALSDEEGSQWSVRLAMYYLGYTSIGKSTTGYNQVYSLAKTFYPTLKVPPFKPLSDYSLQTFLFEEACNQLGILTTDVKGTYALPATKPPRVMQIMSSFILPPKSGGAEGVGTKTLVVIGLLGLAALVVVGSRMKKGA